MHTLPFYFRHANITLATNSGVDSSSLALEILSLNHNATWINLLRKVTAERMGVKFKRLTGSFVTITASGCVDRFHSVSYSNT